MSEPAGTQPPSLQSPDADPVDAFITFVEGRARALAQVRTAEAQAAGNALVTAMRALAEALDRAAAAVPAPTAH